MDERFCQLEALEAFADVCARLPGGRSEAAELLAACRAALGAPPAPAFTEAELLLGWLVVVAGPHRGTPRTAPRFRADTTPRTLALYRVWTAAVAARGGSARAALATRAALAAVAEVGQAFEAAIRPQRIWTAAQGADLEERVRAFCARAHLDDAAFRAVLARDARLDVDHLTRVTALANLRTQTDTRLQEIGTHYATWAPLVRRLTGDAAGLGAAERGRAEELARLAGEVPRLVRQRGLRDTRRATVEDAYHDALLTRLREYRYERDLIPWLVAVVVNAVRDEIEEMILHEPAPLGEYDPPAAGPDPGPAVPATDARAVLTTLRTRFDQVLATFPPDDRPLVRLFWRARLEVILTGRPVTLAALEAQAAHLARGVTPPVLSRHRTRLNPCIARRMEVLRYVCEEAPPDAPELVTDEAIAFRVQLRHGPLDDEDRPALRVLAAWARANRPPAPRTEGHA